MNAELRNKIEYMVVCISEFANRYALTFRQSYNYLDFYKMLRGGASVLHRGCRR